MRTLKEMREKQATLVAQAREKLEEIKPDTAESRAKELEGAYDAIMAEHDALDAKIERQRKLEAAEERVNAPDPRRPQIPAAEVPLDETRAFERFLRGTADRDALALLRRAPVEGRAQSTTTTGGGYLVPQGFMAELVKSMVFYGPMLDPGITRELVTERGNNIEWPTMDDTSNEGQLLTENSAETELALTFGQKVLDAYKYSSRLILVSEELMQDDAVGIEAIVREAMAERIGRIVNRHLTVGTGSSQPNGIVTASGAGATAAAEATIAFDDLINLVHSVDIAYRQGPRVRFMFHDSTLKALRKLKDSQNLYIWQPADVRTAAPATLLSYPYSINNAMAELSGSESPDLAEKTVLFGDFSKYVVRRVREFSVKRLVERYAEYFQVGFVGMGRFDGELLDAGAVKHLVHPLA